MKYLATILLCIACAVMAQSDDHPARIAHMVQECRAQMALGTCRAQNAPRLPDELRNIPMHLGTLGVVSTGSYMDFQEAGTAMCDMIESACTSDWDGERCRVARATWPQE